MTDAGADASSMIDAVWEYESGEVDVSIALRTTLSSPCVSTGRVRIDEALASVRTYRMPETACDVIRVQADGDLVLFDAPTGHNWASEPLHVDTERERIRLGPLTDRESGTTYRFELSAPRCAASCTCPQLVRFAGDEMTALPFGRLCD